MLFNSIKNEREQKQVEERLIQAYARQHIVAMKGPASEARSVNVRIPGSRKSLLPTGWSASQHRLIDVW